MANSKDLFIPISTSGNSPNVISAVRVAKKIKVRCVGLTGGAQSFLSNEVECIKVPTTVTAHIQECHIMIGHFLCKYVEERFF